MGGYVLRNVVGIHCFSSNLLTAESYQLIMKYLLIIKGGLVRKEDLVWGALSGSLFRNAVLFSSH